MNYGKGIRLARAAKQISQKNLALQARLDPSYISMIEANRRSPSTPVLESIAGALQIPLYLLILLSSESADLRGLTEKQALSIGRDLLATLLAAQRGHNG